jgi:aspartyl aminopeptidase
MATKNYKQLEKKLTIQKQNSWEVWDDKTSKQAFQFSDRYKDFLNQAKTEFESVIYGVKVLEKAGFKDVTQLKSLKKGDKVYFVQKDRSLAAAVIGEDLIRDGMNLLMAHVDACHLSFKIPPLYEDEELAFLKTHYYGGIKKYQWPTIQLALHGVAYLENGKRVEINLGEDEADPVFMITDLLPHLDRPGPPGSQIKKREVKGEDLNILVGSIPVKNKKIKEKVKLQILEKIYEKYKLTEEDFSYADLKAVPADKARDLGFDRSMVVGYGHDDRVCAYTIFKAFIDSKPIKRTKVCIWIDKEDTGSEGNTGAKSLFFDKFIADIVGKSSPKNKGNIKEVYEVYSKTKAISADVSPAIDPDYKEVHDMKRDRRLSYGIDIEKFIGAGGKYFTAEASAQYLNEILKIFKKNKKIKYQLGSATGKIDQGGGGTIGVYLANRNMELIDMGIPVLNIHAPMEIASKADIYTAYLAYKDLYENL